MKARYLAIPGILLLALGLILGLLPHSVTTVGGGTVECGSALGGRSDVQEAILQRENRAALLTPTLQGLQGTAVRNLAAECDSARMSWLPWVLIIVGAFVLIAAIMVGMRRTAPRSAAR